MADLDQLKNELDQIDDKMAELFSKRLQLSEEIAKEKVKLGDRMYDSARSQEKIARLSASAKTNLERHGIQEIWTQLGAMDRKLQYHVLKKNGASGKLPFFEVEQLVTDPHEVRVVYQGTEGAYSQAAMFQFFGEEINSFNVRTWRDAMEAISDGAADFAVLPIENSTAGVVGDNFDLLVDFENYIVGQQVIRCEHVLMGLPGTSLADIDTVYSHQQALSQCAQYLGTHPAWKSVPWSNTAFAARKVAEDGLKNQAAIGSVFAAKRFGLEVLAEKIYSNAANSTRFIIVTNQRIFPKNAKKVSICFEGKHSSGSLYHILSNIIYNDLNMSMIESRPIPGRNWEYRFFVDFDGNLNDSSVRNALRGIRMEAMNMKILGNY